VRAGATYSCFIEIFGGVPRAVALFALEIENFSVESLLFGLFQIS